MRLELSGLHGDPVTPCLAPSAAPAPIAFPFPFSLLLPPLHWGVHRHSYSRLLLVEEEGGGLLKSFQQGSGQQGSGQSENPAQE